VRAAGLILLIAILPSLARANDPAPPAAMTDPLVELAEQSAVEWKFDRLLATVERDLQALMEDPASNAEPIARLAVYRQFARFCARITEPTDQDKASAALLPHQPRLMRSLMLAVDGADRPDGVLAVLAALQSDAGKRVERAPELISALCVVFDDDSDNEDAKPQVDRAVLLYRYFTNARGNLRFDPFDLPAALGVYLVDVRVTPEEIVWVVNRYGRRGSVLGIYYDVPYDTRAFYQGVNQQIEGQPYTLENLTKFGGICTDQAYFATQVTRLLGAPATTVTGQGGGGQVPHAWVGSLELRGRQLFWNFTDGRYDAQLYYTGSIIDPQTRRRLTEGHLAMLAELRNVTPEARQQSVAIFRSHDLAPEAIRADWLMRAIDLSPANHAAWAALADLGAARKLSVEQMNRVADVTHTFAAGPYADVAFDIFKRLISGLSNQEQIEKLGRIGEVFRQRRDLYAATRVEQGKLLRALSRDADALVAYGDVLLNHLYAGPVVMEALREVDEMLINTDPRRLLAIYERTFSNMPRPQVSAFSSHTPYARVGQRYIELLAEYGRPGQAATIQSQLNPYLHGTGLPARR
jgi:hypothetical protein